MNKKQIKEFLTRLEGAEGCNFKEKVKGEPSSVTWKCAGGHNQDLSIAILNKMGISQDEQKKFLGKCTGLGGHCDCEIIFNAAERLL